MRIEELRALMFERHHIWVKRQAGRPKPWTKDPILQSYRFCNVYRELDTVTVWIRETIRTPFAKHRDLWFMLAIARHFNLPSTLEAMRKGGAWPTKDWDPMKAAIVLQDIRGSVYTGAYMINPPTTAELRKLPAHARSKAAWSCIVVLGNLWRQRERFRQAFEDIGTLWGAHQLLLDNRGWGGFMSYEVVSDMRWTRYLKGASDINTWAHMGPGAMRGLNRVFGRELRAKLPQAALLCEAQLLLQRLRHSWPKYWPKLEMREVEHSLCEFDKYERVRLGEGRPRQTYNGLA